VTTVNKVISDYLSNQPITNSRQSNRYCDYKYTKSNRVHE